MVNTQVPTPDSLSSRDRIFVRRACASRDYLDRRAQADVARAFSPRYMRARIVRTQRRIARVIRAAVFVFIAGVCLAFSSWFDPIVSTVLRVVASGFVASAIITTARIFESIESLFDVYFIEDGEMPGFLARLRESVRASRDGATLTPYDIEYTWARGVPMADADGLEILRDAVYTVCLSHKVNLLGMDVDERGLRLVVECADNFEAACVSDALRCGAAAMFTVASAEEFESAPLWRDEVGIQARPIGATDIELRATRQSLWA